MWYILCFILLSFVACKKTDKQPVVTTDAIVEAALPRIDEDSLIIEDFKAIFLEECKKWPVNFHIDTLEERETWYNNLGLSQHKGLRDTRYLLFVEKSINYRSVSIQSIRLSGVDEARAVIDKHCEAYSDAVKRGESWDYVFKYVYAKIPYIAIRIDSTIFEITATNTVGHIMHNTVDVFRKKYNVNNIDVIPCEGNNEGNVAKQIVLPKDNHIDKILADKMKPKIKKWLDFYNLDIYKFWGKQKEGGILADLAINEDTASIHRKEFSKELDDIYQPVLYDYSPNKRFYLNVRETACVYKDDDDGKWHYEGGDDCMEIYLTDRKNMKKALVLWLGSTAYAEAAFWLDNDTFIITGYTYYDIPLRYIYLRGKINADYYIDMDNIPPGSDYFIHDIKSRGVIVGI